MQGQLLSCLRLASEEARARRNHSFHRLPHQRIIEKDVPRDLRGKLLEPLVANDTGLWLICDRQSRRYGEVITSMQRNSLTHDF